MVQRAVFTVAIACVPCGPQARAVLLSMREREENPHGVLKMSAAEQIKPIAAIRLLWSPFLTDSAAWVTVL